MRVRYAIRDSISLVRCVPGLNHLQG